MAESPPLPSKDFAIDPEPQIPQISKEEEIQRLNLSFDYEANLLSDLAGFGNALNYHFQKRSLKKHLSKPLKKGPLQKSSKSASSYASNSHVVHQVKFEILDELPQGMSSEPIEVKPIMSPSMPTSDKSFEPISKPILDLYDPLCPLPSESYGDPVIDSRDSLRHPRHEIHKGHKFDLEERQQ